MDSGVVQVQVWGEDCRGKRSFVSSSSKDGAYGQTALSASGLMFRSSHYHRPLVLSCSNIFTPFVRSAPDFLNVRNEIYIFLHYLLFIIFPSIN